MVDEEAQEVAVPVVGDGRPSLFGDGDGALPVRLQAQAIGSFDVDPALIAPQLVRSGEQVVCKPEPSPLASPA